MIKEQNINKYEIMAPVGSRRELNGSNSGWSKLHLLWYWTTKYALTFSQPLHNRRPSRNCFDMFRTRNKKAI